LLRKKTGLTLLSRGTQSSRSFIFSAFGHCFPGIDAKQREPIGIDLQHPTDFVPVGGLYYIDGATGLEHVRASVKNIWPRLITSREPLVLFNRLWSAAPELRVDIINLTRSKHVVIADEELPGPADLKQIQGEIHLLTISQNQHPFQQLRVTCRRI